MPARPFGGPLLIETDAFGPQLRRGSTPVPGSGARRFDSDADKRFLGAGSVPAFDCDSPTCTETLAMRRFISLACVLALTTAPALAGDGQVSKQSLSRMGLAG